MSEYRLFRDTNNWIIQRKRKSKDAIRWENIAFYSVTKPHLAIGRLLAYLTDNGSFEGDAQSIVERVESALGEGVERLTELLISAENTPS